MFKFNIHHFEQLPLVGILRGFSARELEGMVTATHAGGIINFEVTMNSPEATDRIRLVRELVGSRGNVGAGTVTCVAELEQALAAGASFIVTPTLNPEVLTACLRRAVPVMPGIFTPHEIHDARRLGAKWVKLFPADQYGPRQLRELVAAFPELSFMPTGGITVDSLTTLYHAGARAFGIGSPLFDPRQAREGNWEWFPQQARRFGDAYRSCAG